MPITLPKIDDRRYEELLSEALARIPTHNVEWTNFNRSDPGVTIIEIFAFLTESLLFRANQIPERNYAAFLRLLRIRLQGATAARGIVAIANESMTSHPEPIVLSAELEVRAGSFPFRTTRAVDVLPVEGRFFLKKSITNPTPELEAYYKQLYASFRGSPAGFEPRLYEATPFPSRDGTAAALSDTLDNSIWLALLVRESDAVAEVTPDDMRERIAHRTLSLGVVPSQSASSALLPAGRPFGAQTAVTLRVDRPDVPASGGLPANIAERQPAYRPVPASADGDVFTVPGIVDISLPDAAALRLWNNIDPLEAGVDDLPPMIEDPKVEERVITWLRMTPSAPVPAKLLWMGINAAPVEQRTRVLGERLPDGTGEPDQIVQLAMAPVLAESVSIITSKMPPNATAWTRVDDLSTAAPEVPLDDPRLPPGSAAPRGGHSAVFSVDAESGEVRFGDGMHGARPPAGATIYARYDYSQGKEGNVGAGSINSSSTLPPGFKVTNPIRTWGGADAESVEEGKKQIAQRLQNRDRLVNAGDFFAITLRTPGVDIGRVEVLPTFHPDFAGAEMPGVVTLMLVPAYDPEQPDAPLPRRPFLDAICRYLDPRRLVTTEVVLRGPDYRGIWISIGIKVAAGFNDSEITEAVKKEIIQFLAPTAGGTQTLPDDPAQLFVAGMARRNGWPLGKSVVALELAAVANRVRGVEFVQEDVVLADANGKLLPRIEMTALQLPRILGIAVTNGAPVSLGELRGGTRPGSGTSTGTSTGPDGQTTDSNGTNQGTDGGTPTPTVQIPVIPEECR